MKPSVHDYNDDDDNGANEKLMIHYSGFYISQCSFLGVPFQN